MSFAPSSLAKEYFCSVDLLRSLSFLAIIIFHCTWCFWPEAVPNEAHLGPLFWAATKFARLLFFSGFHIVFLSSFLWALKDTWQIDPKFALRLAAGLLLVNVFAALREGVWVWHWDVYGLFLVGFVSVLFLFKLGYWLPLILGLIQLVLPWWQLDAGGQGFVFQQILIGRCPQDQADWPILPWVGLIWVGFGVGRLVKDRLLPLGKVSMIEWVFWLIGAYSFIPLLGAYYNGPLGNDWACFTFRRPILEFFAHFWFMLGLLRLLLFFDRKIEMLFGWLKSLAINRHFYLAYLSHLLVMPALGGFVVTFCSEGLWILDVGLVLAVLAPELLARKLHNILPLQ